MKIKTLLLSSAAVFVAAGGAQAADLSIAEPVEYVLVCEAFGTGFWYIPGTDTCIKIGGSVEFMIKFQSASWSYSGHTSHWKFVTEATTSFMASSMTDYGRLDGFVKFIGAYDPTNSAVKLDEAWLKLGHVKMGHFGSAQNQSGGFSDGAWRPDTGTNQIQLEWAAAGFGLYLGIEDPRERWGSELDQVYSMPDIVGAITVSQGHWDAKVTAGWASDVWQPNNGVFGSVYGVSGLVNIGADPFKLRVGAAYGTGSSFVGAPSGLAVNGDAMWTAFVSAIWQASPQLGLAGTFGYAANTVTTVTATRAGAKLIWTPVSGFEAYVNGSAWKYSWASEHQWEAKVGFVRSW